MPRVSQGTRTNKSHKSKKVPKSFKVGFLGDLDKRTEFAKVMRANYQAIVEDIGGADDLSHVKDVLAQRFVWLQAILESIETDMVKGTIDRGQALGKWIQAVNSLSGLAKVLGVEKRSSEQPWVSADLVRESETNK